MHQMDADRRVFISTVPFGESNRLPLDLLEEAGIDYAINPLGRRLKQDDLVEMPGDCEAEMAGTEPLTARVLDHAPRLRRISRVGIGLDSVDLAAASEGEFWSPTRLKLPRPQWRS